jgi:hypothetical protein
MVTVAPGMASTCANEHCPNKETEEEDKEEEEDDATEEGSRHGPSTKDVVDLVNDWMQQLRTYRPRLMTEENPQKG